MSKDALISTVTAVLIIFLLGATAAATRRRGGMRPPGPEGGKTTIVEEHLVVAPTRGDLDAEVWFLEAAGWKPKPNTYILVLDLGRGGYGMTLVRSRVMYHG